MTESIPTTPSAEYWIEYLGLHAHPEGGFYREVYRATDRIAGEALPARYEKRPHAAATSIYFLLDAPHVSRFHRLASDEIWYFHAGEAIAIHLLHADGSHQVLRIGPNPASGDSFQSVVPAGTWFAAEVADGAGFGLVGCAVAPGFEFADFEMAEQEALAADYPDHAKLIARLT